MSNRWLSSESLHDVAPYQLAIENNMPREAPTSYNFHAATLPG